MERSESWEVEAAIQGGRVCLPQIRIRNPIPQRDGIRSYGLWKVIGFEGRGPMSGISALIRVLRESAPLSAA